MSPSLAVFLLIMSACAEPQAIDEPADPVGGKADDASWYSRGHVARDVSSTRPAEGYVRDGCFVLTHQDAPIRIRVRIPADGTYDTFVTAFQDAGGSEPARMRWTLDGVPVARHDVTSENGDWQVFHAPLAMTAGVHELQVALENDYWDASTWDDRNLVVCRYGVDNLGEVDYAHLPPGELRTTWRVVMPTSIDRTTAPRRGRVGSGTTTATCTLKGRNPGRGMFDCRVRFALGYDYRHLVRDTGAADAFLGTEVESGYFERYAAATAHASFWPDDPADFSGTLDVTLVDGHELQLRMYLSVQGPYRLIGQGAALQPQ